MPKSDTVSDFQARSGELHQAARLPFMDAACAGLVRDGVPLLSGTSEEEGVQQSQAASALERDPSGAVSAIALLASFTARSEISAMVRPSSAMC